ncbi:MAG: TetR/AcrR family transcriptional regulator [Nakamurella sp.]
MPKIIGDTLADHRDQVRIRLFEAIKHLIVVRGYDAITLADVAAEAGVGRTAVYNHFPDKESVLLGWAVEETEQYLTRLKAALDTEDDPVGQLTVFLRMQMLELATHHTRLAGIGTALSADGRKAIRDHVAPMMQILRDIMQRAMDTGAIAQQDITASVPLISAVTTARFTTGLEGDALENEIEAATSFILHGIAVV